MVCNQGQSDRFQDAFHILIDFRVAETQHAITQLIQRPVSCCIALAMSVEPVLHTVDLDDQPSLTAFEIDNVVRDRRLAAKMKSLLSHFA
jgi:hypothetical protein